MPKGKALAKSNPQRVIRDNLIKEKRLAGETYAKIAKDLDISKGTVQYVLNDEEIKDVLETSTKRLVSLIPLADDNYRKALLSDNEKIRLDASRDLHKTVGIQPSHAVNMFFTNIYNQVNTVLHPDVARALSGGISDITGSNDNIIDVDYETLDGENDIETL